MTTTQTAALNTAADGSLGVTNFPFLPIQVIDAALETKTGIQKGTCPISIFRYAVVGGWIVGTTYRDVPILAQSFVPDPDHIWTATFADDKTQQTPQS